MFEILPSLASADPLRLYEVLYALGSDTPLHLDFEDGNFVPNITFGLNTASAAAKVHKGPLDAHLMTTRPEDWLSPLSALGVTRVCAHIEALPYPKQFLMHAKALRMECGLAFNIKTSLREAQYFANEMDYALIMTAEADYGEQQFFAGALDRVSEARALFPPHLRLWADGGVKPVLLRELCSRGADAAVMGRAVFDSQDPRQAIVEYQNLAHGEFNMP